MWKRLNNTMGNRAPAISQEQDTFDEKYGRVGLGIQTQNRKAPPRPPRTDMDPCTIPWMAVDSYLPRPPALQDNFRPESSIYSQPSQNPIVTRFTNQFADDSEYEDVSPPSSPDWDQPNYRSQQYERNISPIDEMPDVSRLDVGTPPKQAGSYPKASSNIPVVRREKKQQQFAPPIAPPVPTVVTRKDISGESRGRVAHDPRWDPYTGEITTSDRGKPQSTKPGQFVGSGLRSVQKETGVHLGNTSTVTSGGKAPISFGERVRRLKINNASSADRPAWQGATGRQSIVSPVKDQPHVPRLNIPRKSSLQPVPTQLDISTLDIPRKSSRRVTSPTTASHAEAYTPMSTVRSIDGETNPGSVQTHEDVHPTVRSVRGDSGMNSPPVVSPISQDPVVAPLSAATQAARESYGNVDPQPWKPVPEEEPEKSQIFPGSDVYSGQIKYRREDTIDDIERNFREAFAAVSPVSEEPYEEPPSRFSTSIYAPTEAKKTPPQQPYEQPPSRFSISTYAPTEAHGTPRPSVDHDYNYNPSLMATPPRYYGHPEPSSTPTSSRSDPDARYYVHQEPSTTATNPTGVQEPSNILDRRRPQIGTPNSNIHRKAVPVSPIIISMSSSLAPEKRLSTASSMAKNLPMTPAEAESHDLVAQLQAQLDGLAHRKNNITRSIRQMTELMPKDNVMLTEQVRLKREGEKKKIKSLRAEEADIRKEEHDIGLRLHRALKRRDKNAVFEPTGLWVSRVTG